MGFKSPDSISSMAFGPKSLLIWVLGPLGSRYNTLTVAVVQNRAGSGNKMRAYAAMVKLEQTVDCPRLTGSS